MPDRPAGWDEPDRLNRENSNRQAVDNDREERTRQGCGEPVPANPPSSGVSDAPATRWEQFSLQEIYTIRGALSDSRSCHSDRQWYLRCSSLHVELTNALAKARGSVIQSQPTTPEPGTGSQEKA